MKADADLAKRPVLQEEATEVFGEGFDEESGTALGFGPASQGDVVVIDGPAQIFLQIGKGRGRPEGEVDFEPLRQSALLLGHANVRHQAEAMEVDAVLMKVRRFQAIWWTSGGGAPFNEAGKRRSPASRAKGERPQ